MKRQQVVVGVDGGGTKTRAAAYDASEPLSPSAVPIGDAVSGACNIAFMPLSEAISNLNDAVQRCDVDPQDVAALCAAVAGYSFASRRAEALELLQKSYPNAKIRLAPDFAAAFRGALPEGQGIVVIAGTGSVAFGANGGAERRAGGYGYLIDDAGSGYGVGREALAAVLQEIDGTGQMTTLTPRLAEELGVAGWDGLIEAVYGGTIDRVRIASLAKHVALAAEMDDDQVSNRILMRAGGALARLAESVHSGIFEAGSEVKKLARVGSLWEAHGSLSDVFERSCLRFAPELKFVEATEGPVFGAALMAADLLADS